MKISEYTMSAWTPIIRDRKTYINPFYNDKLDQVLQLNNSFQVKLWKNYYCRYMPDFQSTIVSFILCSKKSNHNQLIFIGYYGTSKCCFT